MKEKKVFTNVVKSFSVIIFVLITVFAIRTNVYAYSVSGMKAYTISSGNTTVYNSKMQRIGTIYGNDELTLLGSYSNGTFKVRYNITGSSRTKEGYIYKSAIVVKTSGTQKIANQKITTYKRPGGGTYGYISKGDLCLLMGEKNGYTQVRYPAGRIYKFAWIKYSATASNYSNISNGTYKIATALNTSYVLDVNNYATFNGGNVEIYPYHNTNNEKWRIEGVGNGYYKIIDSNSGKALDVNGGSSSSGTNVQIWDFNNSNAQKWRFINAGNGYYYIVNANGCYLDVQGGTVKNGNNVWVYAQNKSNAQKWKLNQVSVSNNQVNSGENNKGYATYTGVRYDNIGLSNKRVLALNKAKNMVTVQWRAPADFPTWCGKNGSYNYVRATDGTRSTKFIKGKTYTGIPYSMKNHSWDDNAWKNNLNSLTTSKMSGKYYSHGKLTTANGIDCSYFVYAAFKSAVPAYNFTYQTTSTMLNSRYYRKITLSQMKPGDIFLKNGHVMLYVGKSGSKYAVFEADAGDSKCSYNLYSANVINSYKYYRFRGFGD